MAAKKKLQAKVTKLEAKVRKLNAEVDRADGNTARWRKKSKENDATIAVLEERLAKRDKQLSKARRAAAQPEAVSEVAMDEPAPGPDESWTVVRLRAEARSRGLTGMSGKTKAQLLAALS